MGDERMVSGTYGQPKGSGNWKLRRSPEPIWALLGRITKGLATSMRDTKLFNSPHSLAISIPQAAAGGPTRRQDRPSGKPLWVPPGQ